MIKFFRKIRQKMLTENKFSKYLLYAIGEIVLVVIGILIALQINNWNEKRKIQSLEFQFLNRLKSDLVIDTTYFNRRIHDSEELVQSHTKFIIEMHKEQENLKEVQDLFKLFRMNSELLTTQNSAFIELISSGKLDVISNVVLKNDLIMYYGEIERAVKHIQEFNEFSVEVLLNMYRNTPYTVRVFPENDFYVRHDFNSHGEWDFINDPYSPKFQSLELDVSTYMAKHQVFLGYFNDLKNRSSDLIEVIEEEIEN
ncbi:DUF6090 family protein [uncultured Eudoraea sp.]|uniref:DUF6090 family protein n=1 Tax=uncultured Eudoraea sp. TaxID=1035614 RepID=UPI00262FA252|nr:DUF6090 family protein [uncultured Eudoraea sp.]